MIVTVAASEDGTISGIRCPSTTRSSPAFAGVGFTSISAQYLPGGATRNQRSCTGLWSFRACALVVEELVASRWSEEEVSRASGAVAACATSSLALNGSTITVKIAGSSKGCFADADGCSAFKTREIERFVRGAAQQIGTAELPSAKPREPKHTIARDVLHKEVELPLSDGGLSKIEYHRSSDLRTIQRLLVSHA
jgi:hypothetical protein